MKANPGGQIALTEVLGREQLISQIRDTLEHQSIRINAERRIDKTTVIRKLHGGTEIGGVLKLPPGASALPWQDILTNAVRFDLLCSWWTLTRGL